MNIKRIKYLEELMEESNNDPFPLFALGMEFLNGDPTKSLKYFEEVLSRFPDYLPIYYQMGKILEDSDEVRALDIIKRGIEVAEKQKENKTEKELRQLYENISF